MKSELDFVTCASVNLVVEKSVPKVIGHQCIPTQ